MLQMDPNKARIKFQDVAASFTDEEWRLLYEWQSELYEFVMKEIHQAITLLGPLIATSVFSLRPTPKQHLVPEDPPDSEISCINDCSLRFPFHDPDIVKKKPESCLIDQHVGERIEIGSSPSSGSAVASSAESFSEVDEREISSAIHHDSERWGEIIDISDHGENNVLDAFKIKEERESYFGSYQLSDMSETINNPRDHVVKKSAVPFVKKEVGERYVGSYQHPDVRETINSPKGHEDNRPVASFLIKQEGMTYSIDQQVMETGGNINTPTEPAVAASVEPFSEVEEDEPCFTIHQDSERWGEIIDLTDHVSNQTLVPLKIKEEGGSYYDSDEQFDISETTNNLTDQVVNKSVVQFKMKKERGSYVDNYQPPDGRESTNCTTGQEDNRSVASFQIKEEEMTYFLDEQVMETGGSMNTPSDKDASKRKKMEKYSGKCPESALEGANVNVPPSFDSAPEFARQQEPRRDQEQGGETSVPWSNVFRIETRSYLYPGIVQAAADDIRSECNSNANNSKFVHCPQNESTRTSMECEQSHICKEDGSEHQVLYSGLSGINRKQNICYDSTKYGNSINKIKNGIRRQRANSSGRKFPCAKCNKIFSQVGTRNRHQRTHSKERAYQCTGCEKIFNRKDSLTRHQKSHT